MQAILHLNPILLVQRSLKQHSTVSLNQLRSFSYIMGGFFGLVLGLGPVLIHHGQFRIWTIPVCAFFLLTGYFIPQFQKWPYLFWMLCGGVLGYINTRIILSIVFFAIITPMAIVMRLIGKRPLELKFEKEKMSYFEPLEQTGKKMSLLNQF